MNLYQINQKLLNCVKLDDETAVDTETGEIIDIAEIDKLEMAFDEKAINIARWIKSLDADAKALKEEKQKLDARKTACENKAESLRKYLSSIMDGKPLSDATVKISFRPSDVVNVDMETLMKWEGAKEYIKYKDLEPCKADIKKALKSGKVIAGCTLEHKNNIQIG